MKSNPYVGWFRHSPSTAPRFQFSKRTPWCTVPSSLKDCKNSPHIGWFRHAPPSTFDPLKQQQCQTTTPLVLSDEEKDLLWKLLQKLSPSDNKSNMGLFVSGHLPGGGKKYLEKSTSRRSRNQPFVTDLKYSSAEGTLSTVNALSRLASWFLFPLAHDAESSGYRSNEHRHLKKKKKKKKNDDNEDGLLSHILSPYLPSFLEEPPRALPPQEVYATNGTREDDDIDCDAGNHQSSSDLDTSASSAAEEETHQAPKVDRSKDLSLSISSLAEAYYAHQTTTKEFGPSSSGQLAPSLSAATGPVSPHRLDYVITQMDIARMTRNASRHLDVQSILGLPVITYRRSGVKKAASPAMTKAKMDQAGWSWTIVEESEGEQSEPLSPQSGEVDFCVICLEHFVNGDRLRVLPCDHSFVSKNCGVCLLILMKFNVGLIRVMSVSYFVTTACWLYRSLALWISV